MTIPEITAYVMALPVEDVRRLTATENMGWIEGTYPAPGDVARWQVNQRDGLGGVYVKWDSWEDEYGEFIMYRKDWTPDIDRNQSRQVTDKVEENPSIGWRWMEHLPYNQPSIYSSAGILLADIVPKWSPLDESRAALIARMIHKETTKNDTLEVTA